MKRIGELFFMACGFLAVGTAQAQLIGSQLSLTLDAPSLSGAPGQTVGWGFTLVNNSSNWIVIDSTSFVLPTFDGFLGGETNGYGVHAFDPGFLPNGYAFGSYTDFAAVAFIDLAPSQSIHQSFDNLLQTGVGSFTINPGAIPGVTDSIDPTNVSSGQIPGQAIGAIWISYYATTVDVLNPAFNPETDVNQDPVFDRFLTAPASVTIVPEPGGVGLLGIGLCALALLRKSRASTA